MKSGNDSTNRNAVAVSILEAAIVERVKSIELTTRTAWPASFIDQSLTPQDNASSLRRLTHSNSRRSLASSMNAGREVGLLDDLERFMIDIDWQK